MRTRRVEQHNRAVVVGKQQVIPRYPEGALVDSATDERSLGMTFLLA